MGKLLDWLFLTGLVCVYAVEWCQNSQERLGSSCYELLASTRTWQDAQDDCLDIGGEMTIPETLDEHESIWKLFMDKIIEGQLWIGCEKNKTDGRWMRAGLGDYECVYLNWAVNQPSHHSDENCVEMRRQFSGKLNDRLCDALNYVICEFNAFSTTKPPHRASVSPVPFCLEAGTDGYFKAPHA